MIDVGDIYSSINDTNATRFQIRCTIENHFDKQFMIFKKYKSKKIEVPIKALTLFFVDKVKHVRDFENPLDDRGTYLKIFDEEFERYIKSESFIKEIKKYGNIINENGDFKNWSDYLNLKKVREGYFAIDKKGKPVEKDVLKIADKEKDEDRDRAIDLILKEKEQFLSFNTELQFIFSHSALREGWDNPNIFTICTLKKGSNEIAKKQEIGRGLRLPVDIIGNRNCKVELDNTEPVKPEQNYKYDEEINELTVIANDSYENFAKSLQEDFASQTGFNKEEVSDEVILSVFKKLSFDELDDSLEKMALLKTELITNKIISEKGILKKKIDFSKISFQSEFLDSSKEDILNTLENVMKEKGSQRIDVKMVMRNRSLMKSAVLFMKMILFVITIPFLKN